MNANNDEQNSMDDILLNKEKCFRQIMHRITRDGTSMTLPTPIITTITYTLSKQVNVYGSESASSAQLNFMIIVIMIAVTCVISVCLLIAIVCVRRRTTSSSANRRRLNQANINGGIGRGPGDGAEGIGAFPLKSDYGYALDGAAGYMMGVSPTPSDLDILKLGYQPGGYSLVGTADGGPDSHHIINWPNGGAYYPLSNGRDSVAFGSTNEQPLLVPSVDQSQGCATMHLPVYASSCSRLTPNFSVDNSANMPHYSQQTMMGTSSCFSFVPVVSTGYADQTAISGTSNLQSFGDSLLSAGSKADDSGPAETDSRSGMTQYHRSQTLPHSYGLEGQQGTPRHNGTVRSCALSKVNTLCVCSRFVEILSIIPIV